MDIKNKVLNYVLKYNLINDKDSIICAVSGGADSVCMLDLLNSIKDKFGLTLYVAHLNHNLRGEEAKRDELFVKSLSKKYALPFYSKTVDVGKLSKELKISCEEAGRKARYDFFNELKAELGATKIATAHNTNDNVETVLMRILRGTDLKGLSGISPCNDFNVIRPILCLKRAEIEEYLRCKGIDFVTDSTNTENDFTRNKIRNVFLPDIIDGYNSNFIDVFSSNIELYKEGNDFIKKYIDERFLKLASFECYGIKLCISELLNEDTYVQKRIIKKAVFSLTSSNITNTMCSLICDSLTDDTIIDVNEALKFFVKYNTAFFVLKNEKKNFSYKINTFGRHYIYEIASWLEVTEFNGAPCFSDKNTAYFSREFTDCNFILRSRKNGDKINLQNCGNKKIKDILIDEKIPRFIRDLFPVLEYNGEIIWLCGVRDNPAFRKADDNNYIKITLHKENDNA